MSFHQVRYSYPSPPGSSLTGASLEGANTPLITRSLSGDSLPLGGHLIAIETPAAAGTLMPLQAQHPHPNPNPRPRPSPSSSPSPNPNPNCNLQL